MVYFRGVIGVRKDFIVECCRSNEKIVVKGRGGGGWNKLPKIATNKQKHFFTNKETFFHKNANTLS